MDGNGWEMGRMGWDKTVRTGWRGWDGSSISSPSLVFVFVLDLCLGKCVCM